MSKEIILNPYELSIFYATQSLGQDAFCIPLMYDLHSSFLDNNEKILSLQNAWLKTVRENENLQVTINIDIKNELAKKVITKNYKPISISEFNQKYSYEFIIEKLEKKRDLLSYKIAYTFEIMKFSDKVIILMIFNHIIFDAKSINMIIKDFSHNYNLLNKQDASKISQENSSLSKRKFITRDFSAATNEKSINYWKSDFYASRTSMPTKNRTKNKNNKQYHSAFFSFNKEQLEKIENIQISEKLSKFELILGAFTISLLAIFKINKPSFHYIVNARDNADDIGCFTTKLPFSIEVKPAWKIKYLLNEIKKIRKDQKPHQKISSQYISKYSAKQFPNITLSETDFFKNIFILDENLQQNIDLPLFSMEDDLAIRYQFTNEQLLFALTADEDIFGIDFSEKVINIFKSIINNISELIHEDIEPILKKLDMNIGHIDIVDNSLLYETNAESNNSISAPDLALENDIIKIWKGILNTEKINETSNFFVLGGQSIQVISLLNKIRELRPDIEVPISAIFQEPVLRNFCKKIYSRSLSVAPSHFNDEKNIEERPYEISLQQEKFIFLSEMANNPSIYNINFSLVISNVNIQIVKQSFSIVINRHLSLRTVFIKNIDLSYSQMVIPGNKINIEIDDINLDLENDGEEALSNYAGNFLNKEFHFDGSPLTRIKLAKLKNGELLLLMSFSHAIFDGESYAILAHELNSFYNSFLLKNKINLLEPGNTYIQFSKQQRELLNSGKFNEHLTFWKEYLSEESLPINWPKTNLRIKKSERNFSLKKINLDNHYAKSLVALGKDIGCTRFSSFLSVYAIFVSLYTSSNNFYIGIPVSSRHHLNVADVIGSFVNTLMVKIKFHEDINFQEILLETQKNVSLVLQHQDIPPEKVFEHIVENYNNFTIPAIETLFTLQEYKVSSIFGSSIKKINIEPIEGKFNLSLGIECDENDSWCAYIEYDKRIFSDSMITYMCNFFPHLIKALVENPNTPLNKMLLLDPLSMSIYENLNTSSEKKYESKSIVEKLEEQFVLHKDDVAVIDPTVGKITYNELAIKINTLAQHLVNIGIKKNTIVGVCLRHSLESITAFWAIIKVGGVYLPIPTDTTPERMKIILLDTSLQYIITIEMLAHLFENIPYKIFNSPSSFSSLMPFTTSPTLDNDPAYMIYTSGSTGTPKAVIIYHRGLKNFSNSYVLSYNLTSTDKVLHHSPLSFDVSISELMILTAGGTVVISPQNIMLDINTLFLYIEEHKITILGCPPHMLGVFNQLSYNIPNSLRLILSGGEKLYYPQTSNLINKLSISNGYGPTEITICATSHIVTQEDCANEDIPIGKPIGNYNLLVVDPQFNQPVPPGANGILVIGGAGVGQYFNRDDLNKIFFKNYSFLNSKYELMYYTGDWVFVNPENKLVYFIGRKDEQIKIRGHRIEIGEIDQLLLKFPGVTNAATVVIKDQIYSLISESHPDIINIGSIEEYLKERLPAYMIPLKIIIKNEVPLTIHGKKDLKQVSALIINNLNTRKILKPRNRLELYLVEAWEKVLNTEISIDDDFFHVGGNSILAIVLSSMINKKPILGFNISVSHIMKYKTIRNLMNNVVLIKSYQQNCIYPLSENGDMPSLFLFPGIDGKSYEIYQHIFSNIDLNRKIYYIEDPFFGKLNSTNPHETIKYYAQCIIKKLGSETKVCLGGYCFSGLMAYWVALELRKNNIEVINLLLLDTYYPVIGGSVTEHVLNFIHHEEKLLGKHIPERNSYAVQYFKNLHYINKMRKFSEELSCETFLIKSNTSGSTNENTLTNGWPINLLPNIKIFPIFCSHDEIPKVFYAKQSSMIIERIYNKLKELVHQQQSESNKSASNNSYTTNTSENNSFPFSPISRRTFSF